MYKYTIKLQLNDSNNPEARTATRKSAVKFINSLIKLSCQQEGFILQYFNGRLKVVPEKSEPFNLLLASEEKLNIAELKDDCSRFNVASAFKCIFEGEFSPDEKWIFITIIPRTESVAQIVENQFNLYSTKNSVKKELISCPI